MRFRARRELRAFHTEVDAAFMHARAGLARDLAHRERRAGADRIGETDVRDDAVAEEGVGAVARAVDELVREDDVGRRVLLFHRADRAGGEDRVDAEELEAEEIRAVIQFAGREAVAASVTGEKSHADAVDFTDDVRVGWIAERRLDPPFVDDGQPFHLIQAGAADDADACGFVHCGAHFTMWYRHSWQGYCTREAIQFSARL